MQGDAISTHVPKLLTASLPLDLYPAAGPSRPQGQLPNQIQQKKGSHMKALHDSKEYVFKWILRVLYQVGIERVCIYQIFLVLFTWLLNPKLASAVAHVE